MSCTQPILIDRYVVEVLMPDLIGHDRQPSAFLVYLFLHARSAATPQGAVSVSLRGIAEATALSKSVVQTALRTLKRRKLVSATLARRTATPEYRVHLPWRRQREARDARP